jgi:hypothetical protein
MADKKPNPFAGKQAPPFGKKAAPSKPAAGKGKGKPMTRGGGRGR